MLNLMQRYNKKMEYANFRDEKWEILSKKIKNWAKKRTWMCAQRRYRKKKTQDTISGNGAKWAGEKVRDARIMATMMSPKCTLKERKRALRKSAHRTPLLMDKIEKAPQVTAEKITHRLIDGEKEESKNPPTLQERGGLFAISYRLLAVSVI